MSKFKFVFFFIIVLLPIQDLSSTGTALSAASFSNSVKKGNPYVLLKEAENSFVLLTAEWCGPCRMMLPMFEQLAWQTGKDNVSFGVSDVENDAGGEAFAVEYTITSLPLLLVFKDGQLVKSYAGVGGINQLRNYINYDI